MQQQVRMYYRSGTGMRCCTSILHMLCAHSPGGSTFLHEMMHSRHLECVVSSRKSNSINQNVLTSRTFLPNFTPIRFEMTEY